MPDYSRDTIMEMTPNQRKDGKILDIQKNSKNSQCLI